MYSDPVMGFPWMATSIVILFVGGLLVYLFRKLPAPPPLPPSLQELFDLIGPAMPYLVIAVVLWVGLAMLVKAGCQTPSPISAVARFEPFANPTSADLESYIKRVDVATQRLETSMDQLANSTDDTCLIIKDVEEIYVGNIAAPPDESETDLSEDRQARREDVRRKRGQARFNEERALMAKKVSNEPVLECFENEDTVMEAQEELQLVAKDLEVLLETAEVRLIDKKRKQIRADIMFADSQYRKAIKSQEGFTTEKKRTGAELIRHVEVLLRREEAFTRAVQQITDEVNQVKQVQREAKKKGKDLEEGNIAEEDFQKVAPVPAPDKGRCKEGMFQYGSYGGGFCCPTKPTNYSADMRDYTSCPVEGVCALGAETSRGFPLC
jgi:hypothetical protein